MIELTIKPTENLFRPRLTDGTPGNVARRWHGTTSAGIEVYAYVVAVAAVNAADNQALTKAIAEIPGPPLVRSGSGKPPIMFHWFSEHGNPPASSRSGRRIADFADLIGFLAAELVRFPGAFPNVTGTSVDVQECKDPNSIPGFDVHVVTVEGVEVGFTSGPLAAPAMVGGA